MQSFSVAGVLSAGLVATALTQCPDYAEYSKQRNQPLSSGQYQLAYQRPDPACRTFSLPEVEAAIAEVKSLITDPDLSRLFENTFPNTLDTTISWHGTANGTDEELTFITTGDIIAMWLRDSANQLRSYAPLLKANSSTSSLASLFRGAINLQARYILASPHCNAFQPPAESGNEPQDNQWAATDIVFPTYDRKVVFECKYELDSIAAFLQLSTDYFEKTQDAEFFGKYQWADAVRTVLSTTQALLIGTYAADGHVNASPYTFQRTATSATETLMNTGAGSPTKSGTGLVRSAFRPSDDSTIYQLFIPANMMFSSYLATSAEIMSHYNATLAQEMSDFSQSIHKAIEAYGKVENGEYGQVYAYEVDGYGSRNMMDDANIPSLLAAPLVGYVSANDTIYKNTRKFVLGKDNPYYMFGPVINGTGGPHVGPGKAWPMSLIASILTSDDDAEIVTALKTLVSSTDGLGLIHESVNTFNQSDWSRQWFSWANGLFGQMVLDLKERKPHLLGLSYQDI